MHHGEHENKQDHSVSLHHMDSSHKDINSVITCLWPEQFESSDQMELDCCESEFVMPFPTLSSYRSVVEEATSTLTAQRPWATGKHPDVNVLNYLDITLSVSVNNK